MNLRNCKAKFDKKYKGDSHHISVLLSGQNSDF